MTDWVGTNLGTFLTLLAVAAKFFWPHPSILLLRYYLFESFVVVSLFPIESSVTGTNSTSKKVLAATAKSVIGISTKFLVVFGEFWIDQNPKITRIQSVTRSDLDVNFPPKSLILAFLANFWWFWIWIIWQRCRNGQNPKITRFLKCRQIWMWISPKIADFGVFDQF